VVQKCKAILFLLFVLSILSTKSQAQQFNLELVYKDKVSDAFADAFRVLPEFSGKDECRDFLKNQFVPEWRKKGFLEVSIDSLSEEQSSAKAWIHLGPRYAWGTLLLDSSLQALSTSFDAPFQVKQGEVLSIDQLISLQSFYLSALEENGYPFAAVRLDSSYFINNELFGRLTTDKGPLYSIDSIHVEGRVKLNKNFLEQYLAVANLFFGA
jgi:outer membrane protein assembly factor BamA